jgi:hypothetical protein
MTSDVQVSPEAIAQLVQGFPLSRFGVGKHTFRDETGWRTSEINVDSIWLASIRPSRRRGGYLMIVHSKGHPRALFCSIGADGLPLVDRAPIECPGLNDRVAANLKHLNLFPKESHLVLDGISYSLLVRTWAVSSDLAFHSPVADSLRALAKSLYDVTKVLADISGREDMTEFLNLWRDYLH